MRVLAITFGGEEQVSSFYRVYQFSGPLRAHGIDLAITPAATFAAWDELADYDTVIVQKKLFASRVVRRLRRRSRRLVYDVDDAIWEAYGRKHFWLTNWRRRHRVRVVTRAADLCLAANSVLAQTLARWNRQVAVLPMALDETAWFPKQDHPRGRSVRIGWAGHPVNLGYLEAIEPALLAIRGQEPGVEFVVFCGQRPSFRELVCEHIPFQAGAEPEAIRSFDIGLLPLPDVPFAKGKSPIKALQYMACGVPCVASPIGATRELFGTPPAALFARTADEWIEALHALRDPDRRAALANQARALFQAHYALRPVAGRFADLLRSLNLETTSRKKRASPPASTS